MDKPKPASAYELEDYVKDYESLGCHEVGKSLGIQSMPEGYALLLNADRSHFFWLRKDGVESVICWNKWWVYRGAKEDAQNVKDAA